MQECKDCRYCQYIKTENGENLIFCFAHKHIISKELKALICNKNWRIRDATTEMYRS